MKVERDEHTKMKDNAIRELHGLIEHPEKALTNMAPEAEGRGHGRNGETSSPCRRTPGRICRG